MPSFISNNHQAPKTVDPNVFISGCLALAEHRLTDAYTCFVNCEESDIASNFNLALCLYWAQNYKEALSYISKAQRFCKGPIEPTGGIPPKLLEADASSSSYLSPMLKNEASDKKRILRFQADILFALNQTEALKGILVQLEPYHFANLEAIKQKMEELR